MKHCLLLLLFWLSCLPSLAQRPAYRKMSPLVREACLSMLGGTASTRGQRAGSADDTRRMIAFVQVSGQDTRSLEAKGCRILARCGSVCVAEFPLTSIPSLSLDPQVLRIEARHRATACMDTTSVLLHVPEVYAGTGLPRGYTGSGVVVGVQDIGFDLTHPTFYSADGSRYRVAALWDQLSADTLGSSLPAGRDYVGQEALLALGCPRDGRQQTHGTHTAGIAAGSGSEGDGVMSPYRGVAPDADLCLVCNATGDDANLIDEKDYYRYTLALDALGFKYIFDYARRVGKPCVINFSEGSGQDFHGNDQLYYAMLDSLCGPGRIIVSSAGNEGEKITYVHKRAEQDTAGVFMNSAERNVSVTTQCHDDFTLRLRWYQAPGVVTQQYALHDLLALPDSTLHDTLDVAGRRYVLTATAYRSSYDATQTICDWNLERTDTAFYLGPPFSIAACGRGSDVQLYPVTGNFYHDQLDPTLDAGDHTHSILSPSSAPSVICVGATGYRTRWINYLGVPQVYNRGEHGERARFSSVGPTLDGRTKPDVMAPGQNIVSAYSSFYLESNPHASDISSDIRHFQYGDRTYAWNSNAGTSMASPVVAGIIALWLQANPRLTPADCLSIFSRSCTHHDPSLTYPNNVYGYGEIDAYAGLKVAMEMSDNIDDVPKSSRIYSIDGIYRGTDISRLPQGVYIRGGKKFVITRR